MIEEFLLQEVCFDFQNGIGKGKAYYGSGTKVANIGDLYESATFSPVKYSLLEVSDKEIDKYRLHKGDLLFVRSSLKKEGVAYCSTYDSNEICLFSSFMIRVRPDPSQCDSKYLSYILRSNSGRLRLINASNTSTITNISQDGLASVKIPLPPLPQQKKIAAILDAADAYRQKTKALITKYDELTQSLFLDMFGDPVTNNKNLPKIKIGALGKWQSGGTPSRRNPDYYEGNIPWLSSGELNQKYIDDSEEHITEIAITESNSKLIEKGSLLLGMYDTAALKSTITTTIMSCNQAIAYCKLNQELVNTSYVYHVIQIGKEYYRRLQRGVRQKNLNLTMVKGIKILMPPIEQQNQFEKSVYAIESQKEIAQKKLLKSEALFNSLLQKAFKGELTSHMK